MKKIYSLLAALAFLLSACASQTADGIHDLSLAHLRLLRRLG